MRTAGQHHIVLNVDTDRDVPGTPKSRKELACPKKTYERTYTIRIYGSPFSSPLLARRIKHFVYHRRAVRIIEG